MTSEEKTIFLAIKKVVDAGTDCGVASDKISTLLISCAAYHMIDKCCESPEIDRDSAIASKTTQTLFDEINTINEVHH